MIRFYLKMNGFALFTSFGIVSFLAFVIYLTNAFSLQLVLYFWFISILLFVFVFFFDCRSKKELYRFLSGKTDQLLIGDTSNLSQQMKRKMDERLRIEEQMVLKHAQRQQQQITFMNLWVHQMKTPLSVLELMAQNNQLTCHDVLTETHRLKSGLNLALNEARLGTDFQKDFILAPLSLNKIVTNAVNNQKTAFIQRKLFPSVEIEEALQVISDEKWLTFMIEQLLTNALKYSHPQGTIELKAVTEEQAVTLTITDHGIGISASDLPRVKQAFFTGENGRKFGEATGMGLYLVQQVADELGIELTIHSTVGHGTSVALQIPT